MAKVLDAIARLRDQFSPTLQRIGENMRQQERMNNRLAKSVKQIGENFKTVGEKMLPAAIGISTFGAYGVKSFGDFEEAMNKVKVKLDQSDWGRFDELKEQAKQLSTQYAYSAKEIAEAQENIVAAGWNVNAVLSATPTVMNLAAAAGVDMATASSILTDNMTAFGISAEHANEFADMLAVTANATNTSIPLMGESYKYCASAARAMGVDLADVSTLIGQLANSGIKGSEAGTGVKDMLERVAVPSHAKHLKELGVAIEDSSGKFVGMKSILDQLRIAMSNMTDTEKVAKIHEIFGSTALPSVMALLNQTSEDYDTLNQSIRDSAGTCQQAADVMNGGFNAEMKKMVNTVQLAAMNIGEKLVPYIKIASNEILYMANSIRSLDTEQVDLIIKISAVVVALTAIFLIVGQVISWLGTFAIALNGAAAAVTAAGGMLPFLIGGLKSLGMAIAIVGRSLMTLFLNPVGLVILAIAILAFAVYQIYENWGTISEFFSDLWNSVTSVFAESVAIIKTWMDKTGITEKLQALYEKVSVFIEVLIARWNEFYTWYMGYASMIWTPIIEAAMQLWAWLEPIITTGASVISGIFNWMKDYIVNEIMIMVNVACVLFNGMIDNLVIIITGFIGVLSGIITFLTGVFTGDWEMAWQGIVDVFSSIFGTIEGICNSVMSTIKAAINEVISGINNISVDIPDWVPGVGGSHYQPSIPLLARGTDNWGGGPAMIHDAGPEIVDLPNGSRVIPHSDSMRQEYERGKSDNNSNNKAGITIHIENMNVRDKDDIDKIADKIVQKINLHAMNQIEGAF